MSNPYEDLDWLDNVKLPDIPKRIVKINISYELNGGSYDWQWELEEAARLKGYGGDITGEEFLEGDAINKIPDTIGGAFYYDMDKEEIVEITIDLPEGVGSSDMSCDFDCDACHE